MKCPECKEINLVMSERQSIEIDYCPECRGVWLDHGELDKIIERSNSGASPKFESNRNSLKHYNEKYDSYDSGYGRNKQKKKSFFSELFDF